MNEELRLAAVAAVGQMIRVTIDDRWTEERIKLVYWRTECLLTHLMSDPVTRTRKEPDP